MKLKNDKNNSQVLNYIINNVIKACLGQKLPFLFSIFMWDILWQEREEGIKGDRERRKKEREWQEGRRKKKEKKLQYFYYIYLYNCSIL